MPVQLTIKVNGELVRKGLQDLAAEVPKIGRQTVYEKLSDAKRELAKEPTSPKPPGLWDSEKQQVAFFKTDGFGGGIPYTPTGRAARSWVIRALAEGWKLYNTFKGAVYLFGNYEGERQSVIHAGRRGNFKEVVEKHIRTLPGNIEKRIKYYARKLGLT